MYFWRRSCSASNSLVLTCVARSLESSASLRACPNTSADHRQVMSDPLTLGAGQEMASPTIAAAVGFQIRGSEWELRGIVNSDYCGSWS